MHWAAHGHTAAEIIIDRADGTKENMGMTNFVGNRPTLDEAKVAKNYLNKEELDVLNRIVSMYLDFAELQALNGKPMYMKDWAKKLDDFLRTSERDILTHSGFPTPRPWKKPAGNMKNTVSLLGTCLHR